MKQLISNFFSTPLIGTESGAVVKKQLNLILRALFLLSLAFFIPFFFAPAALKLRYLVIALLIAPACLVLWQVSQRGQVRAAAISLVALLWIVVTLGSITAGGIHAPIFIGYLVTIMVASILLGGTAAVITTVGSLLSGGLMVIAEATGWLPAARVTYPPYGTFIVYAFFTLSVLILQRLASSELGEALNAVRAELDERRRAENAQRASEERLRNIFDLAPYGILITTADDFIVETNTGFTEIIGMTPEQLRGKHLLETGFLADPSQLDKLSTEFQRLEGVLDNVEITLRRSDGSLRGLLFSARRIEFEGQLHTLIICTDITARKQAEERAQKSADQLSILNEVGRAVTALQNLPQILDLIRQQVGKGMLLDFFMVALFDLDQNTITFPLIYEAGQTWQEPATDIDPETKLGRVLFQGESIIYLRTTEQIAALAPPSETLLGDHTRVSASLLYVPLTVKGSIIGAISAQSYTLNAYTDEHLQLLQGMAVHAAIAIENARLFMNLEQELAERKQVETALRESEARLRAVIDQIPYDLWVCDAEGRYIMQNQAGGHSFPNTLGKTPQELIADGLPPELAQRWDNEHRRALAGEIVHSNLIEEIIDGERRSFIITVSPITIERRTIGLTGLSVDVTELRRAEEEVRQLNDELEKRVVERTLELEQANQELQAFSYSVSHDLRAPLRSIRSYGQILKNDFSDQLDPLARNFLEKVIRSADEMNELIDSLLALFRFSRGDLHRKTINLSAEATAVLEKLRQAEPARSVSYQVANGLSANADEALLRNVFENLLGNAWKYSSQNPAAQIEFGSEQFGSETIYFVRDNGAGFDMQYASQLFKPFQRLHRADEFPGHGIGLATVQRIIQRHGGRIWAEAAVGQGATFYFTLG